MNLRRTALAGIAGAAALAPAAPALALGPITDKADNIDPVVRMAERAHERVQDRHVKLYRTNSELRGSDGDDRRRAKSEDWSIRHLRRVNEDLEERNRELRKAAAAVPAGGSTAAPHLEAIAACESGGDPTAVDPSGTYRGKYQFDMQTWASVGGTGDPAAAPEAEQDARAAMLYARSGAAPWPVCGA